MVLYVFLIRVQIELELEKKKKQAQIFKIQILRSYLKRRTKAGSLLQINHFLSKKVAHIFIFSIFWNQSPNRIWIREKKKLNKSSK